MVAVRMVQVTGDEVVDVIAVRYLLVPATGSVDMIGVVAAAVMVGRALRGVGGVDSEAMFVHVVAVRMVHVAIVEVVGVAVMSDRGVAAALAVRMRVTGVRVAWFLRHFVLLM